MLLRYEFVIEVDESTYETPTPSYILAVEKEALESGELDLNELFENARLVSVRIALT
jgi:hypothetical protein